MLNQQGQSKFTLGNLSYDSNSDIQTLKRAMGGTANQLTYKSNLDQFMIQGMSARTTLRSLPALHMMAKVE